VKKPPRRLVCTIAPGEEGVRLDAFVAEWLAHALRRSLSKSVVRKLVMAGAIRLNGRPARRPGAILSAGTVLEAHVDAARIDAGTAEAATSPRADPTILHEDDDLIAVAKPAGLVMHATADPRRQDLFNTVRLLLARRRGETAVPDRLPYLGLHHRLDVETSGVVLFTKQERANAALAQQFAQGEVTKTYHAITGRPGGRTPREWRVENRLAMSDGGRRARMQDAPTGGEHAVTQFQVLEVLPAALLVQARPETGRKHQIRAHLAGSRLPILGDIRYGGPSRARRCVAPRVMLHALSLSLRHPVTREALTISCPYPHDFSAFLDCLRASRDVC
jgi:23S rRNA pseudouridine955/2504/2580 synthase/23S rRNA pseudouridine1911/1915/1917 synthase